MLVNLKRYDKACFWIIAGVLIIGILFSAVNVLLVDGDSVMALFFYNTTDTWMDTYNSVQGAIAENPYAELGNGVIYPPICNLYFRLLSHVFHTHEAGTWDGSALGMRETQSGRMLVMYLSILYTLLLAMSLSTILQKQSRGKRYAIILLMLFSAPMVYLLERGNLLLLTLSLMGMFLAGYKNERPVVRELALICLGLAFSFKLYPAALGLLLLKDKRWAASLRTAVYGLAFLVLPIFFYQGFDTLRAFIASLTYGVESTGMYRVRVDVTGLAAYLFDAQPAAFVTIARLVLCGGALLSACVLKKTWQQVAALCLLMIYLPGFSYYYVATLLIFPCIMFLADSEKRRQDMLYAVCYAGMLVVIMCPASYEPFISAVGQISPSMRLCNLSLGVFSAILIGEGIVTALKMLRQKAAPAKI